MMYCSSRTIEFIDPLKAGFAALGLHLLNQLNAGQDVRNVIQAPNLGCNAR